MKRTFRVLLAVLGILAAGAGGVRGYMVWDRGRDRLPEFRAPDLSHRAPTGESALYGIRVGIDGRASIDEWLSRQHIQCRDTSMRALMVAKREQIAFDMANAKARGDDPDMVTGASMVNYRSTSEQNPQVRLSCEDVLGTSLPGHPAQTATGRLLIILDSAQHPVRHVSHAYHLADNDQVLAAWNASVQHMTLRFGPPTSGVSSDPLSGHDFQPGRLFKREWLFGDLRVEVSALRIGRRPVGLRETLEVPWPVQSDAPAILAQPIAESVDRRDLTLPQIDRGFGGGLRDHDASGAMPSGLPASAIETLRVSDRRGDRVTREHRRKADTAKDLREFRVGPSPPVPEG